jgi:hypothetical protein
MRILNDPAYLRDTQTTSYELQVPTETVWQDGSEWRLVSYLAFDAAKVRKQFARQSPFDAIAKHLAPLEPKWTEFAVGKKRLLLVYAQPYAPLLQTALRQIDQKNLDWHKLIVGAGQLLVSLPSAPVTYLFWNRDVVQFKRDEQAAAKKICQSCKIEYKWDELPPGQKVKPMALTDGPSWRWWTKYFNEFEIGVEWPQLWEGVDWRPSIEGMGGYLISKESLKRCPKISKWPRKYQGKLIGSLKGILGWPGYNRLRSPEGIQFLKLLDSLSRTDLAE